MNPFLKKILNTQILNQYQIEFELIDNSFPNIKQFEFTNINFALSSYLSIQPYVNYLTNEILVEINKALNSQPFDNDGGGENTFLEIGFPSSTFSYATSTTKTVSIPTSDLKEIILSWIEFLTMNGIVQ